MKCEQGKKRTMLSGILAGVLFFVFATVAGAEGNALPLTIKSNGNAYTIKDFTTGKNDKGDTTITISGSGFGKMPIRNGNMVMPVWCSFISGGEEYEWENVSNEQESVTFIFSSSKTPEKIRFYAEDDRDKKYDFDNK